MQNTIRYIARFKVEAASALRVGSGQKGVLIDNLIARDANELPYIPGASLAGVIRHELKENSPHSSQIQNIFGYQEKKENEGLGSRIVFSPALLLAEDNKSVHEGLQLIDFSKDYYAHLKRLPERDHVRINHRGTAVDKAKYEEELTPKGTRFVFEIELEGTPADEEVWNHLLGVLHHPAFRVGAGTRKGFGQLKVLECRCRQFDLKKREDLAAYLNKNSSLNSTWIDWERYEVEEIVDSRWRRYRVNLTPECFFFFGSGIGDKDPDNKSKVDTTPKTEQFFQWEDNRPTVVEQTLIPATSLKGAIAHRVAFHYNKLTEDVRIEKAKPGSGSADLSFDAQEAAKDFDFKIDPNSLDMPADSEEWDRLIEEIDARNYKDTPQWQTFMDDYHEKIGMLLDESAETGEQNEAIKILFGYANSEDDGARGKVIFSDVYLLKTEEKIFNHVAIDRFTGGGIEGALFQEKVTHADGFSFDLFVEKDAFLNEKVKQAFEKALKDLTSGLLQLGGNTTKGHGAFSGEWQEIKLVENED